MERMQTLPRRQQEVLKIVVDEYVSNAAPVSSGAIARRRTLGVSPASVRSDMAELEEDGYIHRPHIASGGMPSDKGYRYFVEYLAEPEEISETEKLQILERLRGAERDLDAWIMLSASLLARLVQNVAVITFPRAQRPRLHQVDLVQIQDLLGLLVLVFQQTQVRKGLLPLRVPVSREDLQQTANKLSALCGGLTLHEIQAKAASLALTPLDRHVLEQTLLLMQQEEAALHEGAVQGLPHLLSQPEFTNVAGRLSGLSTLTDPARIVASVSAQSPDALSPRVVIGAENEDESLREFSLVISRYGLPGSALGTVAIVGPTRLNYERAVASVRYFSQVLGDLLENVRGAA
jgi:heat-inducible transcriptional repressor